MESTSETSDKILQRASGNAELCSHHDLLNPKIRTHRLLRMAEIAPLATQSCARPKISRIALFVPLGVAIGAWAFHLQNPPQINLKLACVLSVPCAFVLFANYLSNETGRQLATQAHTATGNFHPQQREFRPDGLYVTTTEGELQIPWTVFRSVKVTPDHAILESYAFPPYYLARHMFDGDKQWRCVSEFLRAELQTHHQGIALAKKSLLNVNIPTDFLPVRQVRNIATLTEQHGEVKVAGEPAGPTDAISFAGALTWNEYQESQDIYHNKHRVLLSQCGCVAIALICLTIPITLIVAATHWLGGPTGDVAMLLAMIGAMFVSAIAFLTIRDSGRARATLLRDSEYGSGMFGPVYGLIDHQRLLVCTRSECEEHSWDTFDAFHPTPQLILLRFRHFGTHYVIPNHWFKNIADQALALEILKAHIPFDDSAATT